MEVDTEHKVTEVHRKIDALENKVRQFREYGETK